MSPECGGQNKNIFRETNLEFKIQRSTMLRYIVCGDHQKDAESEYFYFCEISQILIQLFVPWNYKINWIFQTTRWCQVFLQSGPVSQHGEGVALARM